MIKAANVAKGSKVISKQRPQIIEEVEKLLLVFINEKRLKGDNLSEAFICKKPLDIYDDLVKKTLVRIPTTLTSKQADDGLKKKWNSQCT